MPKPLDSNENNLLRNLKTYADSITKDERIEKPGDPITPLHEYVHSKIEEYALREELDDTEEARRKLKSVPAAATIEVWINEPRKWPKNIQKRFETTLYGFIQEVLPEARIMEITEHDEVKRLYRFFGYQPHLIKDVGPQISGIWNMYRRWTKPLDRYLISPVRIVYDREHSVIIAYDKVQISLDGAHSRHAPEKWVGVVIPQGRYVYLVFRVTDQEDGNVKNLKFVVLDDIELSEELVDGSYAYHYMSGQTMIGVNSHPGSNSFVTVLERVSEETFPEPNPVALRRLPVPVQDLLENKEIIT